MALAPEDVSVVVVEPLQGDGELKEEDGELRDIEPEGDADASTGEMPPAELAVVAAIVPLLPAPPPLRIVGLGKCSSAPPPPVGPPPSMPALGVHIPPGPGPPPPDPAALALPGGCGSSGRGRILRGCAIAVKSSVNAARFCAACSPCGVPDIFCWEETDKPVAPEEEELSEPLSLLNTQSGVSTARTSSSESWARADGRSCGDSAGVAVLAGAAPFDQPFMNTFTGLRTDIEEGSIEYARKKGYDAVCCGHTHHASAKSDLPVAYYNSGCWTELPSTYLTLSNGQIELLTFGAAAMEEHASEPALALSGE